MGSIVTSDTGPYITHMVERMDEWLVVEIWQGKGKTLVDELAVQSILLSLLSSNVFRSRHAQMG